MRLITHSVRDFRNLAAVDATFSPGVTVITGDNGEGKTNLLESIFLLTGARTFRHGRDAELIRYGKDLSVIESELFLGNREQRIRLTVSAEQGRRASKNGDKIGPAAKIAGTFCCVIFSPEHLQLVKGGPEGRRRFLDTALCQLSTEYLLALRYYTRLVRQKNALLKDSWKVDNLSAMLDVLDEQLAASAFTIMNHRERFVKDLEVEATAVYDALSGGREQLSLTYSATLAAKEGAANAEICRAEIRAARETDLRIGSCRIGPHRDDLGLCIDGKDARTFASQGQQRSAVLALKLAEAASMAKSLGEEPVLLLDDLLSELDLNRQTVLLRALCGRQSIVTSCDPAFLSRETGAAVLKIKNGALVC